MKQPGSLLRRLAYGLIRFAAWLLPKNRADWARSMHSELHHLENDFEALIWALGCAVASLKEGLNAMTIGNLKISRWILVPEMALCFVPLTLAWLDGVFGMSGIIRLNMDVIQQYFIGSPAGVTALMTMFSTAILGVLGPVGLIMAIRLIVLDRSIRSRSLGMALIGGPILIGIIHLARSLIIDKGLQIFDALALLLLFSILPAIGAAHLLYLGSSSPDQESLA